MKKFSGLFFTAYLLIVCLIWLMANCHLNKSNPETESEYKTEASNSKKDYNLSMYAAPKAGYKRHVITLPVEVNEADFKVEIFGGKVMQIDCNKHKLGGAFQKMDVQGLDYSYLEFDGKGDAASTLIACPDNITHEEFVKSKSELVRHNSKLPIVVYALEGIDIKYRLWKRGNEEMEATLK